MDKLYSITEVSEMLRVNYKTVHKWVKSGAMQAYKIGGSWRVSQEQIEEFLKSSDNTG